jgi:hypothetical protein
MPFDWRQLSAQQMNEHFNPRVACPDAQEHLDRFVARSAQARQAVPGLFDYWWPLAVTNQWVGLINRNATPTSAAPKN